MLVVIPGLSSVQVESVEPVFKVAILALQLLVVHLHINTHSMFVSACALTAVIHNTVAPAFSQVLRL